MQRGRAGKGGSEVGRGCRNLPTSVFRVVRARSAWGEEPEKCRGPCGPPAGVRPCASKERRGGFRIGGAQACGMESGMGAGASGHGMRSVGDCWGAREGYVGTSRGGRRRVSESRRRYPNRDGLSRAAHGRYAHGAAGGEAALHAERLRCCAARPSEEGGRLMMGINEKDERRELLDAVADAGKAGEGTGPAARVHGARRPAGPSRRRGHTGPEVDKREMRRAHRRGRAHPGDAERGLLC